MSTEPDRDPVTDAFLRKALQPNPQTGSDGCVDAETLAAWADGNLPADRAADVEAHLAGCSRCQAAFSTFAMTDESAAPASSPAAVIPFTPKSPVRWLLPMAASVAATLVLWTVVRDRTTPAAPELQERLAKSVAEAPASPVANTPTPASPTVLAERQFAAARKEEKTVGSSAPKVSAAPVAAPVAAPLAAPAPTAFPPPPAVMLQPPPAAPPATANTAAATRDVTAAGANAEPFRLDSENWALAKVVAEFSPPPAAAPGFARPLAGGGRGGGGGAAGAGGGGRSAAQAPADRAAAHVRWRVLASGMVMKSTNDGEWAVVTITPAVFILNGHAPSPTVCWLVGRAGIVMLSTDGTKFMRVRFPDVSDLRSITAIDAQQATVTTVDGRVFTTFDAGETWQLKH